MSESALARSVYGLFTGEAGLLSMFVSRHTVANEYICPYFIDEINTAFDLSPTERFYVCWRR